MWLSAKLHITNTYSDIYWQCCSCFAKWALLRDEAHYPWSCSDLLASVITQVAMIERVELNPFKAPVLTEKTTLLSAVHYWAFDQQQISLISAPYYLYCPWFDTNFRITLPRFSGQLAWPFEPIPVNKRPSSLPVAGWEPQSWGSVFV